MELDYDEFMKNIRELIVEEVAKALKEHMESDHRTSLSTSVNAINHVYDVMNKQQKIVEGIMDNFIEVCEKLNIEVKPPTVLQ